MSHGFGTPIDIANSAIEKTRKGLEALNIGLNNEALSHFSRAKQASEYAVKMCTTERSKQILVAVENTLLEVQSRLRQKEKSEYIQDELPEPVPDYSGGIDTDDKLDGGGSPHVDKLDSISDMTQFSSDSADLEADYSKYSIREEDQYEDLGDEVEGVDGSDEKPIEELLTMESYQSAEKAVLSLLDQNQDQDINLAEDERSESKTKAKATGKITSTVEWGDIAGLDGAKSALREAVVLPSMYPHFFTGRRKPWMRILLFGPPGTGKTRLAEAVATETGRQFFSISSADVVSCYFGESEKLIRTLFDDAKKNSPSIVFFDEIDAIARIRSTSEDETVRRIKTELLRQLEGVGSNADSGTPSVFFLASTNCPWDLDKAILRRFERRIYVPLPESRGEIVKVHLRGIDHSLTDEDFALLDEKSHGLSGSDLAGAVKEAIMKPLRELDTGDSSVVVEKLQLRKVNLGDILSALTKTKATVTEGDLVQFEAFAKQYGEGGL